LKTRKKRSPNVKQDIKDEFARICEDSYISNIKN